MAAVYLIIKENGSYFMREAERVDGYDAVGKALVHFRLQTLGQTPYAAWELYGLDGAQVDSCFVSGKVENVNAEATVYKKDGVQFVVFELREYGGEAFRITDVRFEKPLDKLFDGETLYQLPPAWAQSMSYVMTTKNGQVIVVDGGCEQDTPRLESFIKEKGGVIHHLFVTHYHNDHIGAVIG